MRRAKWKSRGIQNLDFAESLYENRTVCEICNATNNLRLDHCHISAKARGILCNRCNLALGQFYDDPKLLQRAIDYLGNIRYN